MRDARGDGGTPSRGAGRNWPGRCAVTTTGMLATVYLTPTLAVLRKQQPGLIDIALIVDETQLEPCPARGPISRSAWARPEGRHVGSPGAVATIGYGFYATRGYLAADATGRPDFRRLRRESAGLPRSRLAAPRRPPSPGRLSVKFPHGAGRSGAGRARHRRPAALCRKGVWSAAETIATPPQHGARALAAGCTET